jgi:L,D-peptidoglycan transpeptidase YkuD (ErfK/YbiS/YcfS/YnhG family)
VRLALLTLLVAVRANAAPFRLPDATRQLVVVVSASWDATTARLARFARGGPGETWRAVGAPVVVALGRTGLAWGRGLHPDGAPGPRKREGDGRSPAGVFRLRQATGYAPTPPPGATLDYRQASARLRCVDDAQAAEYNQLVDEGASKGWRSDEPMLRGDELYARTIVVDHNQSPIVPGEGSCIFLHVWRGPGAPTVGCTAMARGELESLLAWLSRDAQPLLVQLPLAIYRERAPEWGLPQWRL